MDAHVDREDFSALKTRFNPPGRRRFVYIDHTGWFKNAPGLSEIARRMPEAEFACMGRREESPGLEALGRRDFATDEANAALSRSTTSWSSSGPLTRTCGPRGQLFAAIESDESPPLLPAPLTRTLRIRWLALRSPYSVLRRENLRLAARTLLASNGPGGALLERRRWRWEALTKSWSGTSVPALSARKIP